MQNEKLRATVTELEQELLASHNLDDATRLRLHEALAEIRVALQQNEPPNSEATSFAPGSPTQESPTTGSLSTGLTKAIEDFEGAHPTLVNIIGRLADGLAQMGI